MAARNYPPPRGIVTPRTQAGSPGTHLGVTNFPCLINIHAVKYLCDFIVVDVVVRQHLSQFLRRRRRGGTAGPADRRDGGATHLEGDVTLVSGVDLLERIPELRKLHGQRKEVGSIWQWEAT